MIITGGENVYPREVEELLYTRPEVQECAVVGLPDKEWGRTGHRFCRAS
jgi:long-chain acyl-CoA synthetase